MPDSFYYFLEAWLSPAAKRERERQIQAYTQMQDIDYFYPQVLALSAKLERWLLSFGGEGKFLSWSYPVAAVMGQIDRNPDWVSHPMFRLRENHIQLRAQTVSFLLIDEYGGRKTEFETAFTPATQINNRTLDSVPAELHACIEPDEDWQWAFNGSDLRYLICDMPLKMLRAYRDTLLDCYFGTEFYGNICQKKALMMQVSLWAVGANDTPMSIRMALGELYRKHEILAEGMLKAQRGDAE